MTSDHLPPALPAGTIAAVIALAQQFLAQQRQAATLAYGRDARPRSKP